MKSEIDNKRREKWKQTHKIINGIDHKFCKSCEEYLPSTDEYFYKNKSNSIDGLHTYCKPCSVKKSRKRTLGRLEETAEYKRKYYLENREKLIAQITETNNLNIDRRKETLRLWQQRNPDKIREYNLKRRMSKEHEITNKEWEACKEYFDYRCAYCYMTEEEAVKLYGNKLHKEHVEHDGSNDITNCVPACKSCNGSKHTAELDDWYNYENERFSGKRLRKIYTWLEIDVYKHMENSK